MQCTYLNYIVRKNHVSSQRLEEATHLSPSTISRIRSGTRPASQQEFEQLLLAAGSDLQSFNAFVDAFNASPNVTTAQTPTDESISSIRQFYQDQIVALESRYQAEIDRLNAAHEKELAFMSALYDKQAARMDDYYAKLIDHLK